MIISSAINNRHSQKKKKLKNDTIPLKYANGLRLNIVYNLTTLYSILITRDYWITNMIKIFFLDSKSKTRNIIKQYYFYDSILRIR